MIEWAELITNAGFPIAVTIYLLFRFERVINRHTEVLNSHTSIIRELCIRINGKR